MKIGGFQVDRIVDMEGDGYRYSRGFPGLSRDTMLAHARRLGPQSIDPYSLDLLLSFHSYLVRTTSRTILIDACIGNDKERPQRPGWHRRNGDFLDRLGTVGIAPHDVDVVMCTHLHADHVGWNTKRVDGRWVPTFPNARYVMAETEYLHLKAQTEKFGAGHNQGCFADSVLPVVESGQAEMVSLSHRVESGVYTEGVPGHTPGSVLIHLEDGLSHGVCTGDLLHHPFQLSCPAMPTQYCEDPIEAASQRVRFCERYADTRTRVLTAHFPNPSVGRIVREDAAFGFVFDDAD